MNDKIKENLKFLSFPLILLIAYLFVYITWQALGLPTDERLLVITQNWFAHYGLWVVFIGALFEGFLLLGQYFPGGFIIFLGVITAGSIPRAIEVVVLVDIAFFIAYSLNYLVGKYGWYKLLMKFGLGGPIENAKAKVSKQGMNAIFFTYWEPNLASITATAAGILGVPFKKFSLYSALGILVWETFWGTLVYSLGDKALQVIGLKYVLTIFAGWISILFIKKYLGKRKV